MTQSELHVQAKDRKTGMSIDEISDALAAARTSGFTIMGRTEVGFGGQIQSIKFKKPARTDK